MLVFNQAEAAVKRCGCRSDQQDVCHRVVARDVRRVVKEIERDPRVLSIIRNGGWELWLRNLLLLGMERTGGLGFTEGANGSRRADLLFRCLHCEGVRFAVELKTNFFSQPGAVAKNIRNARGQLELMREGGGLIVGGSVPG